MEVQVRLNLKNIFL